MTQQVRRLRLITVAALVLATMMLGSCSKISELTDDLAETLGHSADEVQQQLEELADETGRTVDDLARDAQALADDLPLDTIDRIGRLASGFGIGSAIAIDVVCGALDKVGDDGEVSTEELATVLASEAIEAGIDNTTAYASQVSQILLDGDPDNEYDVTNLALDQVRTCVLENV
ncbi:MAG: hypothetical protein EXQ79_06980 [Acidimicrobiia bacterium]|nr:hypothetical protein [Acidimicrobiia bacterium]